MIYTKIKEICNKKGISVTSVEKQAGLGNGTISKWSEVSPSVDNLKKVADILKVKISDLV